MIELIWWGHACFEIVYGNINLVIDPHDGVSLGRNFRAPMTVAKYVLVTHRHYDHDAVEVVTNRDTEILYEKEGRFSIGPFNVEGIRLPHDEFDGRIRGHVVAYIIEIEGLRLIHLSDIGRPLNEEEVTRIGSIDVVLVPVGNVYTILPHEAIEIAEKLKAKVLIPMHYWVTGMQLPLDPLDSFLRFTKKWKVVRMDTNKVILSRDKLPGEKSIYVLKSPLRRG